MKKIVMVILGLLLVISSFSTPAQVVALEDIISTEDIDVEFMENQIESIEQYQKMLESFNVGEKIRSVDEQLYDDNYGGSYIDENGELVVLLVEDDTYGTSIIEQATGNNDIQTVKCQYSFNELISVIEIINENFDYFLENGISITEMYEDVYTNTVKIGVFELDEEKEKIIREVVDSPCMDIFSDNEFMVINEVDMKGEIK